MCDRTCYHLVLGLGGVAFYSVVSALLANTRRHTRTHCMAAKEPEELDAAAVKAMSSREKGPIILVIWDDWDRKKTV